MTRTRRLPALAVLMLSGCAVDPPVGDPSLERVVLLPGADGRSGSVVVEQAGREWTLDAPWAETRTRDGQVVEQRLAAPDEVRARFADVLSALPPAPAAYVLFFNFALDELSEDSRRAVGPVLSDIASRPAPEVTVIGHADQVGTEKANEALSLRRAERIREMLMQRGVAADRITVAGRGAREPLVRGVDGAPEPRNRRVEIVVR